ncbi:MAG: hypothetical protein KGH79_01485 [Patescibacteria group bacterium]|nr:hypothetical protein [Patescibacteria group bacterium]
MNKAKKEGQMKYLYLFGGAVGDALLGLHLARTLDAARPGSRLLLISTRHNTFVRELMRSIPFAQYVELPKTDFKSWVTLVMLAISSCRAAVFEPLSAPMPLWWTLLLRAATTRKNSYAVLCSTQECQRNPRERVVSYDCRTENMFDLVPRISAAWGLPAPVLQPVLEISQYSVSERLQEPYIVFHFFAPSVLRSFPPPHSLELLRSVRKKFPQHRLVLTCSRSQQVQAEQLATAVDAEVLCDSAPSELILVLARASVYVGVDTGITHLACHLGTSCVVLGNCSNPCWLPYYAPQAIILFEKARCTCKGDKKGDCRAYVDGRPYYRCLLDITEKEIIEAIEQKLNY